MNLTIQEFTEIECLFFIKLSYLDFKELNLGDVSFLRPVPVSELMESLEAAENSAYGANAGSETAWEKAIQRHRAVYNQSSRLQGMKLIGYMNDNDNNYGTTRTSGKSGMAAQAYSDRDGNIIITYRGNEKASFRASFQDLKSQGMTYLGITTSQFRLAHSFFNEIASVAKANIIVMGEQIGGSLALYTYIMEKEKRQNLSGIAINVDKNALLWKKLKAEKYLLTEDFILKRGIKKELQADMIDGMFTEIAQRKKEESDNFYQNVETCLKKLTIEKKNYYDTIPMLLEKLRRRIQADVLVLWFRHADKNGEYIVPYSVEGNVMPGLQHLKLREGENIICASAFTGAGKLFPSVRELGMVSFAHHETGDESMVCVPIGKDKPIGALQVSRIGEHWKMDEEDYQKISFFADRLAEYLQMFRREIFYDDDDYYVQIYDRTIQKPVFSLQEAENRTMVFSRKSAYEGVIGRLMGQNLSEGETLKFSGTCFTSSDTEKIKEYIKGRISTLFQQEYADEDTLMVLMQSFIKTDSDWEYVHRLNNVLQFEEFKNHPFSSLSDKEKVIFHTCLMMLERSEFIIAYPYPYPMNDKTKEWADSMLRFLAAGERRTMLKFEMENEM